MTYEEAAEVAKEIVGKMMRDVAECMRVVANDQRLDAAQMRVAIRHLADKAEKMGEALLTAEQLRERLEGPKGPKN